MVATSGFLTALECTKFDLGRPRTLLGSLQRSPRPSNWFKWALLLRGGEGSKGVEEERERKGSRMEVKGRRGEEGRKVETSPPSVTAYAPEQMAIVRQDFNCSPADLWRKAFVVVVV